MQSYNQGGDETVQHGLGNISVLEKAYLKLNVQKYNIMSQTMLEQYFRGRMETTLELIYLDR